MLIDANHLQLTLERRTILKDVSLHLERGEIYGLLGPNGAGKSTTIAILLGLHTPRAGRLSLFDGEDSDPRKMRLRIGVMPEQESLYLRLTTPGEAVGLEAAP